MCGSFSIPRFPENMNRHVVYVETQTDSLYMEDFERQILMYDYPRGQTLG